MQFSLKSKFWNVIIFVAIFYTNTSFTMATSGCFQCMSLMNRTWNEAVHECMGNVSDCGKCIEGYDFGKGGQCNPKAQVVINGNGAYVVPDNAKVILKCEFRERVDCAWSRRGYLVDINGRYSFLNETEIQTKYCSIQIVGFNGVDTGYWHCRSMADASHIAILSTAVNLFKGRVMQIDNQGTNTNVRVPLGETVLLKCGFKEPVDCAWSRKDHFVIIQGRYAYTNDANGQRTDDCSIIIKSFKSIDVGMWRCQTTGDSSTPSLQLTSVKLSEVTDPSIVNIPKNATASKGTKVILTCTFNAEVECQWQHNETTANYNHYNFLDNDINVKTRRNCSIEIPSLSEEKAGAWTCNYTNSHNENNRSHIAWITVLHGKIPEAQNSGVSLAEISTMKGIDKGPSIDSTTAFSIGNSSIEGNNSETVVVTSSEHWITAVGIVAVGLLLLAVAGTVILVKKFRCNEERTTNSTNKNTEKKVLKKKDPEKQVSSPEKTSIKTSKVLPYSD